MLTTQIPAADALLDEVVTAAKAAGMHIIGNGRRIVISPVIPAGWIKLGVKVVNRQQAKLEALPCAA